MDVVITVLFHIFAFFSLFFALYEERDQDEDESTTTSGTDELIVILLVLATAFFVLGGITMMFISETYYSPITDTLEEVLMPSYRPLGWIGILFGISSAILLTVKVFDILEKRGGGDIKVGG